MKYTHKIEINLPRDQVIELFDSAENMTKWQPELISFEHVSGTPGQEGAKSKLLYKMGGRETEMIETITNRNFPDEFSGTYEAKGVWNLQENFFKETGENNTEWMTISEFRCSGFMKIICWLMPGAFKKQTLKFMKRFKDFAENTN
jgi:hypothetical protein